MKEFRFFDWDIYKDAKETFNFTVKLVNKFPQNIKFELGNQMLRSSLSIVLNIAEGSGKSSDAELNRFFNIAMGSLYETLAAIDLAKDNKLLTNEEFDMMYNKLVSIARQLGGFKKGLNKK